MMRQFLYILFAAAALSIAATADIQAQESSGQGLEFSTRAHNFGKISVAEGPKHCTFEFKNILSRACRIHGLADSAAALESIKQGSKVFVTNYEKA